MLWVALGTVAEAAIRNAKSCSYSDVRTQVAAASNGDTVTIPACAETTWNSTLSPSKKYISLQGAGIGRTIIKCHRPTADGNPIACIDWTTIAGGLTRITGIEFRGADLPTADKGQANIPIVELRGVSGQLRIDNNSFKRRREAALFLHDYIRGVVDHNTFDDTNKPVFDVTGIHAYCCAVYIQHNTWDSPGTAFGDKSWASASTFGTAEALYFEDNTATYDNAGKPTTDLLSFWIDGWFGHRVVVRFNTCVNVFCYSNHGTDSGGRQRSARHFEAYKNAVTYSGRQTG